MHSKRSFLRFSLIKKFLSDEVMQERTYFALTILTGIAAGLVATSLNYATHYLTNLIGTNVEFTPMTFIYGGLFVFVSGYLTTRKFPSTAGSGIPGVRISLAVYHGKITPRATIAKFFTSVLSLSSGVSLGREGPTVAIAAGVGSFLGNFFSLSKKKVKALVAIGSAGGIAAAFNTPISAVVFTLEEVVGDLNAKILGSIIISTVVASITASILMGEHTVFSQLYYQLNDFRELFFYLAIGLVAAVVGPLWMKTVLLMRKYNLKIFKTHKLTIIMLAFFIVGLLSYIHPSVLGSGHEKIEETLLSLILDWRVLLTIFVLKFIATSLSYASGISGGLFMPTLLMGATIGSLVGAISGQLFPEITSNSGAYALVGMGAYFATVIRAPFTSILMVFELTRNYNIILPLMIANIVAYIISSKFTDGSIYEKISEQDGIHLPTREDNDILENLIVEDAMVSDPISLNSSITINDAFIGIKKYNFSGFPILRNGLLSGMVSSSEIGSQYAKGNGSDILQEICETKIVKIYPDQSLLVAFHKLKKHHVSRLPVVSRINDCRLVGIITAENIVAQFGYHIQEEHPDNDLERYEVEFQETCQKKEKDS